ncbi:hypothetical protein HS088_TW01G00513 [Tripterygium wilfordii]|uniref:SNF2 domain-containing protein CLASSY 1-like n=1 Tax=Tripterygium wilfordii TaxID=458696 RepID=A0A7J7E1W5_TRIWF|nr:SNF2 domain-containing protein CLASSY 2-like [Tripterygium wilfordii]KAF5752598.1 hypothetical protein HS088_TW01G00513 [Tripterygium wilfordii]
MKRRRLYEPKHPFNAYPFEALSCGSWKAVEIIQIKDAAMNLHFMDGQHVIEEKGPIANLRVRSRQAIVSDCTCFLRPGVDVCVLSPPRKTENSERGKLEPVKKESLDPVWTDAKISTIERMPHVSHCSCRFFVHFYTNQGPLGSERGTLTKDTEEVGINQISIFQKLEQNACEDEFYRWSSSEDCSMVQRTKLLLGKFLSDLTWLLAVSALKNVTFEVRSKQNKIVYQIVGIEDECCSPNSDNHLHTMNFKVENDVLTPIMFKYVPLSAITASPASDMLEAGPLTYFDVHSLRRSKRRQVQPDRFLGCDVPSELEIGIVRTLPYKTGKYIEEEELVFSSPRMFSINSSISPEPAQHGLKVHSPVLNPCKDLIVYQRRNKSTKVTSGSANEGEHHIPLAIVPAPNEIHLLALKIDHLETKIPENDTRQVDEIPLKKSNTKGAPVVQRKNNVSKLKNKRSKSRLEENASQSNPQSRKYSSVQSRGDDNSELEDMVSESKWKGKASQSNFQSRRYSSVQSKRDDYSEPFAFRRNTLSDGAYNKIINSYMKNIDSSKTEEPRKLDECKEITGNCSEQRKEMDSPEEEEEEVSETEMLWKEMEMAMASAYVLEDNEVSSVARSTKSAEEAPEGCRHYYILDEEVGILCRLCGTVKTEIKYVTPPFLENAGCTARPFNEEAAEHMQVEDEDLDFVCNDGSPDTISPENKDNVWALIPELGKKLRSHQKKAFEFLWENIAGSLMPAQMEQASKKPASKKKIGGCVISHSPGAGKTFLIIAFLVSYLKLFPGAKPLVLAPKTTLYTWYKEFIKWEIPIPVHLIHGRRTYRVFKSKKVTIRGGPKPSLDVMHVIDCLDKIQKWHEQPSVLVMGYTSFLSLMRENSKFAHRRYMAKVLRESPGLLVLDEGHNPRSTKSRLRKALMKVETDLRVLLSGTLFQNNFCEYFNTLCLARPKFVNEVLKRDPKYKRRKKGSKKAFHLLESRARKFFIDNIGKKIDSSGGDDRIEGINMLRNLTSGFIDVHENANSENLPGLQLYTLLMNSTEIQQGVVSKLQTIMDSFKGYPLELELLITLASIHPSLVRTSNCAKKFFTPEELVKLEELKLDFRKGSKVMFVLNLVYRVIQKEKVLIFCHNIAPINLFVGLFERIFQWQKGREVLVLTGDLELFDRGQVMDRFEVAGGPSRVLLASITACCEGISLTAASRVIMLDSEWNPSKTKQAIARAFRPGQQKMVFVYQLLATGSLEEDKYRRTTWKEWVSSMIFSEEFVEDPSKWQAEKIEDDVLREMVEEDRAKSFNMIMKNEKASTSGSATRIVQ